MRAIAPHAIHLWLCHTDRVADSRTWLRQLLSKYAPVTPLAWAFEEIGEGKPRLLPGQAGLDFNLSHSGDWLACALTAGQPVGVDIEWDNPRRDVMRLARRFFNPQEVTALTACEGAQQRRLFYDLWTLKEATVKSRAEAVAPLLDALSFEVDYRLRPARVAAGFDGDSANYCLLRPAPQYHLALCLPGRERALALRIFRVGADAQEEELDLPSAGLSVSPGQ